MDGRKDILGQWVSDGSEGANFWLSVITDLQSRGVKDILIACVDGLKGFREAINSVFPQTVVQPCIIHKIRNSLRYVSWKDKKEFMSDLKLVYKAATKSAAETALDELEDKWQDKYMLLSESGERTGITSPSTSTTQLRLDA
jgi:transposase-like protein